MERLGWSVRQLRERLPSWLPLEIRNTLALDATRSRQASQTSASEPFVDRPADVSDVVAKLAEVVHGEAGDVLVNENAH